MADIFLSYASEDRDRIVPLVTALESAGWSIWWDRELLTGTTYADVIQSEIEQAACIVVVWSQHAVASSWVRDEAQEGLDQNKLVPCSIDDARPPLGFRSIQTTALRNWPRQQDQLGQLIDGIQATLAADGDAAPASSASYLARRAQSAAEAVENSIAVLPFTNLSSDAEQQYFCDGLVEDIITDLSCIKLLVVISRNSSFSYRSDSPDVGVIASELGVNYVLLGSVRRSGERVRVSARLVSGRTEETLWSKRFDGTNDDLFALQDDLTRQIVTALDVKIASGEPARKYQRYRNADSRELLYRGIFEFRKFEHTASLAARRYFLQFADAEPDSVEGYSWLVTTVAFAIVVGWEPPQEALPQLRQWIDRALELEPDNGYALVGDGIYKVLAGDLHEALKSSDRAVEVEPNLDEAWMFRGWNLMFLGEADAAVESLERAIRLSPLPNSTRYGVLGTALRNAGRYEEAVATLKACLRRFPDFFYAHTSLAIVYGMMGDEAAARREVARTLEMDPSYTVARFVNPNLYLDPAIMARCGEVLKAAGMPES